MKVLGIDPGLHVTGYGLVDAGTDPPALLEAGVIRTNSKGTLEIRLAELFAGIEEIIAEFAPDVLAVEELYAHYKHPRTAVVMGHARGVLFCAAGAAGIPVRSYSATRIKKALTGVGHASKEQIARMVAMLLQCPQPVVRSDVTDAIAAALCHIHTIRYGGSE